MITKYKVIVANVTYEFLNEQEAINFAVANNTTYSSFQELPAPLPLAFETYNARVSQQLSIEFAQNLLYDWMRKNTYEGMTIPQSLWVFARFEEFQITSTFGTKRVDLFKMFNSGAIPTLYYCLIRVQPDAMTESFHWLAQERLDWVKTRIEEFLGGGMVAYIQSLP